MAKRKRSSEQKARERRKKRKMICSPALKHVERQKKLVIRNWKKMKETDQITLFIPKNRQLTKAVNNIQTLKVLTYQLN